MRTTSRTSSSCSASSGRPTTSSATSASSTAPTPLPRSWSWVTETSLRRVRCGIALAGALTALAFLAQPASAAATRTEYVAQADPICHGATVQAKRILRKKHLSDRIDPSVLRSGDHDAALRIASAYAVTRKTYNRSIDQIAAIPAPPGDETVIARWVTDLQSYRRAVNRMILNIRRDRDRTAYKNLQSAYVPLSADRRNLTPWEFQYCV